MTSLFTEALVIPDTEERRASLLQLLLPLTHNQSRMKTLVRRCALQDLFWLGIEHHAIWIAAADSLHASLGNVNRVANNNQFGAGHRLGNVGVETLNVIISNFNLRDLCNFAATCRYFRHSCQAYFDNYLNGLFATFGLGWLDIRSMLVHTQSVISGFFVYHMLFMDYPDDIVDKCRFIDIYVKGRKHFDGVVAFFATTGYRKVDESVAGNPPTIRKVRMRIGKDTEGPEVAVHRCKAAPEAVVMNSKFSSSFIWMSATGIVVGYPNLTFESRAIISHTRFSQTDTAHADVWQQRAALVRRHGIAVTPYHRGGREVCGISETCPSVIRSTSDARTFSMDYDLHLRLGVARNYPVARGVSWCLGSMDCVEGRQAVPQFVSAFEPSSEERADRNLATILEEAFGSPTIPQ
ncbi:hypothetical protein B0H12DRAFT_1232093 [Mycena haematopus]|nr:hypothetical protein B0H12DRAFT_1232093 [Mycena haematopus]